MILQKLKDKNLINPPKFLISNCQYIARCGSVSFGISNDCSDEDLVGFAIPSKEILFPHLAGVINGFGHQGEKFDQFQIHHIKDEDEDKEYDINIYNIARYCDLLLKGNPSLIESLFVHQKNILHMTSIGNLFKDNRKKFLSKQMAFKLRAYAASQFSKIESKKAVGKRKEAIDRLGFCPKFASHSLRLLFEAEQILLNGDLDLESNSQILLSVKKGDWKLPDIYSLIQTKQLELEKLIPNSKLPAISNESEIKELLLNCLEIHYGSLSKCIVKEDVYINALKNIKNQLDLVGI